MEPRGTGIGRGTRGWRGGGVCYWKREILKQYYILLFGAMVVVFGRLAKANWIMNSVWASTFVGLVRYGCVCCGRWRCCRLLLVVIQLNVSASFICTNYSNNMLFCGQLSIDDERQQSRSPPELGRAHINLSIIFIVFSCASPFAYLRIYIHIFNFLPLPLICVQYFTSFYRHRIVWVRPCSRVYYSDSIFVSYHHRFAHRFRNGSDSFRFILLFFLFVRPTCVRSMFIRLLIY